MSLKPLGLGLLVSIVVSAGLAVAAHAAGQVLEGGAEGLAALLVRSGPPRADEPARTSTDPRSVASSPPASPAPRSASSSPPASPVPRSASSSPPPSPALRSASSVARSARVTPPRAPRLRTDAPTCDDVYVYIVSIFENVKDSVATLALDAKARGRPRRVGQRLGRYEVIGIGYNADRVSSAVWLAEGGRVCQALVRAAHPVRKKQQIQQARAKQKASAGKAKKAKKRKRRSSKRHR